MQGTIENDEIVAFIRVRYYAMLARTDLTKIAGSGRCRRPIGHVTNEPHPNWTERLDHIASMTI